MNRRMTIRRPSRRRLTIAALAAALALGVALPAAATAAPAHTAGDGQIDVAALGHDSHSDVYRMPQRDVHPGTPVTLRFRTAHDDVDSVSLRLIEAATRTVPMTRVASDVSCYDPALAGSRCDFWSYRFTPDALGEISYRFVVTDGPTTMYYSVANYPYGGAGTASSTEPTTSYLVHVVSNLAVIPWMQNGVMYEIYPDRFYNGDPGNDPSTTQPRYDYPAPPDATPAQKQAADLAQVQRRSWNQLPEGYCRAYVDPATPCTEQELGRDYFGGDLQGITDKLGYLRHLGVTILYLMPSFAAASDHGYDIRDYQHIAANLGGDTAFHQLLTAAHRDGMKVMLDGPFDAVSSDSQFFDRYHHFSTVGACESPSSPYRSWFVFHDLPAGTDGPCAGSTPGTRASYDEWGGNQPDLPLLRKADPTDPSKPYAPVANYEYSMARYWLQQGVDGWRLDSMTDASFPLSYWQGFRAAVKAVKPDAPLLGEAIFSDMPLTRGDTADTEMGYRFWWAVMSLLGGTGQPTPPMSQIVDQFASIQQDYPSAMTYMYMNLLDSQDTARMRWALTPGQDNRESKEFNAANVAIGRARAAAAAVVQFTMPGTPAIFYGDEVGLTGDNDPDNRRPFPWTSTGSCQGPDYCAGGDHTTLARYEQLIALRRQTPVLRDGRLQFLTSSGATALAYAMTSDRQDALTVVNPSTSQNARVSIDVSGLLRDGVRLRTAYGSGVGNGVTVSGGRVSLDLPPLGAAVLLTPAGQPLTGPAVHGLTATGGSGSVTLHWSAAAGAASYRVYRSPLSGGGFEPVGTASGTGFVDTGAPGGATSYYVVRSVDHLGNLGPASAQAAGAP